jgi:hypothetical protein
MKIFTVMNSTSHNSLNYFLSFWIHIVSIDSDIAISDSELSFAGKQIWE